jgi:hypothetical protein
VISLSFRDLLDKFAVGFSVNGIFVLTPQELFPVVQDNPGIYLALKRKPKFTEGTSEIIISDNPFGLIVNALTDEFTILIITNLKNVNEVQSHWNRFAPVIREKVQLKDFILQESIETRVLNRLEDIRILMMDSVNIFKEKSKDGRRIE